MSETTDIEYRPKVLCSTFAPIPGAAGIASRLLERLPQLTLDYEIDVICLRNEDQAHLEKYAGCKIYRVSAPGKEFTSQLKVFRRSIRRLLEGGDYDLVHFTDPFAGSELITASSTYGYRTIFEVTSLPSWELREIPWVIADNIPNKVIDAVKRDERLCLKRADVILTGSEVTRKILIERGAKAQTTFKLAGGGVLGQFLENIHKSAPPTVILIGRHAPWYDFTTLLDAVKSLVKKNYKLSLLIVGPDDNKITPKILKGIERRGLQDLVVLNAEVGFDEVPPLLQKASIGVIPLVAGKRFMEGGVVPRKFYEYLAAALPILATDTPAMRELSNDGKDILLCEPGSAKSLAKKLAELLDDENLRNEYAYKSLKLYKTHFHPDIAAAALRRIYNALVHKKPVTQTMLKPDSKVFLPPTKDDYEERYLDLPGFEELAQDDVTRDLIKHEREVAIVSEDATNPGIKPTIDPDEVDSDITPITKRKEEEELKTFDMEALLEESKEDSAEKEEEALNIEEGGEEGFPLPNENTSPGARPAKEKSAEDKETVKREFVYSGETADVPPPQPSAKTGDAEGKKEPEEDETIPEPTEIVYHQRQDDEGMEKKPETIKPSKVIVHDPPPSSGRRSEIKPSKKAPTSQPKIIIEGDESIRALKKSKDENTK
ncbi:MAG: hypothetical protein Kow0090_10680 [Myxococcota bacterium]